MTNFQKPPPNWAQLTYTSADSVTGAKGGWGVKERSPAATDLMISEMLKGVSTRIVEVNPTSNFPSDEDLRTRPRRLLFRLVDGVPTMWHAATAGPDATGRPGNVYTHAAMMLSSDASLRPIQYWRTASWLTPFGAAAVTEAKLADLRPGTVITRQSTLAFIDHGEREYTVEWLLAAVTYAVNRGQTLVLASGSDDEAAGWIGVISFLTAPALARRISWVTYDRAGDVEATAQRGINVICVPRDDLPALLESRPVDSLILDPDWVLDVPGDNKMWVANDGQTFPADSDWAGAFLDLIALQPAQRMRVLTETDGIAASLEPSELAALPFHWPLAMALLSDGEAVVNNREDVLFNCLDLAPITSLTSLAGKRLLAELIADSDSDELVAADGYASKTLMEAILLAVAERYVGGGWRDGGHWPKLTTASIERLKLEMGPRIRVAVEQAVADADGADAQVLAAAKLFSFVATYQLGPEPRTVDEPDVVVILLGKVKARVTAAGFVIGPDDVGDLHARLLPTPSYASPASRIVAPVSAQVAPPPRSRFERATPAAPPTLALPVVTPAATPSYPDARASMAEGLRALPPGSDAARGVAQSILMTSGVNPPSHVNVSLHAADGDRLLKEATAHLLLADPFWSTDDNAEAHRREELVAEAFMADPPLHELLRQELLGWMAVAEALQETARAVNSRVPVKPFEPIMQALRVDRTTAVRQFAEAVQRAGVPVAASLVAAGIYRGILRQPDSILGMQDADGVPLGIAGARLGVAGLDEIRRADVWTAALPYLDDFNKRSGTQQVARTAQEVFGRHEPQSVTKRGKIRGR